MAKNIKTGKRYKSFSVIINVCTNDPAPVELQEIVNYLQKHKFPNKIKLEKILLTIEIPTRYKETRIENFVGQLERDSHNRIYWRLYIQTKFQTQVNKVIKAFSKNIYGLNYSSLAIQACVSDDFELVKAELETKNQISLKNSSYFPPTFSYESAQLNSIYSLTK